ncbi:MAG: hypothetical protein AMK72_14270, partial [Planctomycetes bacterium SM23_25]
MATLAVRGAARDRSAVDAASGRAMMTPQAPAIPASRAGADRPAEAGEVWTMARSLVVMLAVAFLPAAVGCKGGAREPEGKVTSTAGFDALFPGDSLTGWRVSHWAGVHL